MAIFNFENTFIKLPEIFYQKIKPEIAISPKLIKWNKQLAADLKLEISENNKELLAILSGQTLDQGSEPIALTYAGHQFGHFNPQLGDGRAVLLGEHVSHDHRWDIQLKGSGRTAFSRRGDGKSALGPALREYLISEALNHLNIPTTRTLAVLETGETVFRDKPLPGGISVRVASSHVRIGSFEYFAARKDLQNLQKLTNYAIYRHDKELYCETNQGSPQIYTAFLKKVIQRQAQLVAQWMSIGFIHGVMNTDNTLISGESIDFGPCAFMDNYDPNTVFSSIDTHGRYAYANQPLVMRWNLACLAECLLPFLHQDQDQAIKIATEAIEEFPEIYENFHFELFSKKLGLDKNVSSAKLIKDFLEILTEHNFDFTNSFRNLKLLLNTPKLNNHNYNGGDLPGRSQEFLDVFNYNQKAIHWKQLWLAELSAQNISRAKVELNINQKNPFLIPRNHSIELALAEASENQNYNLFLKWTDALRVPYIENELTKIFAPAPESPDPQYQTFCGT